TLGPSTQSEEVLINMIKAGVDVFRVNFSHAQYSDVKERIDTIRKIGASLGKVPAILADLQGPKLRIGMMKRDVILRPNDTITFVTGKEFEGTAERVYMNYALFPQDVKA